MKSLLSIMEGREPDPTEPRHKGNAESEAAFAKLSAALPQARWEVLEVVRRAGLHGTTSKEICAKLNKTPNQISGRLTELLDGKLIVDSNRRRDGCRVVCSAEAVLPRQ